MKVNYYATMDAPSTIEAAFGSARDPGIFSDQVVQAAAGVAELAEAAAEVEAVAEGDRIYATINQ